MNQKREHIAHIEGRYGISVRIEGDPAFGPAPIFAKSSRPRHGL